MTNQTDEGRRPLTIDEAAEKLALSPSTVRRRIEDGTIRSVRIGHAVRIPRDEIDLLLAPADLSDDMTADERRDALAALSAAGRVIAVPVPWLIASPSRHGGRPHGYIALVPLTLGVADGSSRRLEVGDLLAADEGGNVHAMVLRHQVAELPLDRGVLALLRMAFAGRAAVEG